MLAQKLNFVSAQVCKGPALVGYIFCTVVSWMEANICSMYTSAAKSHLAVAVVNKMSISFQAGHSEFKQALCGILDKLSDTKVRRFYFWNFINLAMSDGKFTLQPILNK